MFEVFAHPEAWVSLLTLTVLEVVLGIDNIIFISILTGKLPTHQRDKGRKIGLAGAFITRLLLLSVASWIIQLTKPLFSVGPYDISGKSLILMTGGLFLLYKATKEIHGKLESAEHQNSPLGPGAVTFRSVIIQIMLLDMVFSIDSVITAVGMARSLLIMVIANLIALLVMLLSANKIASFVEDHPTVKILALSFLLMIGLVLIAEGFGVHIPKGYIYFAMGFSVFVEMINIRTSRKTKPIKLRNEPSAEGT